MCYNGVRKLKNNLKLYITITENIGIKIGANYMKNHMKIFMALTVSLVLAMGLCACGYGTTPQMDTNSPVDTAMTEKEGVVQEKVRMSIPEDKGDMVGVYKWVEMADIGVNANLIITEDGIGVLDMLGVTESVTYDDTTMQSSGEGALPQNYTYANGTLIWTAKDDTGESKSTFIKLTEEELAEYQKRGIGNAE